MKQLSITVADWIVEQYLFNATNVSSRISELIIKGSEAEEMNVHVKDRRILMLKDEVKFRDEEVKKLKQHIGRLEEAINKKPQLKQNQISTYENLNPESVNCVICSYPTTKTHKLDIGLICNECFMSGRDSNRWIKKDDKPEGGAV